MKTVADVQTIFKCNKSFISSGKIRSFADAYWVPIELLSVVKSLYKAEGIRIRVRFRGPRIQAVGRQMGMVKYFGEQRYFARTRTQAMQDCLKEDATHFCVYRKFD